MATVTTLYPGAVRIPTAGYGRTSTDRQELSVANQKIIIEQVAISRSNEYEVFDLVETYFDEGESGYTGSILDRPAMRRLMDAIESGRIKCVIIKGSSRFARDDAEAAMMLSVWEGLGVRLLSHEEAYDSTKDKRSVLEVHNFISKLESSRKSESVKAALRAKRSRGEFKGGIPPYGMDYDPQTKKLRPNALASIVEDAFIMASQGHGPTKIARTWNETRKWAKLDARMWTTSQLQRMLRRHCYCGDAVGGTVQYSYAHTIEQTKSGGRAFGGKKRRAKFLPPAAATVVHGAYEPIVSRELFDLVQSILDSRKLVKERRAPNARYPLTGLLICGECGGSMMHHGRNQGLHLYYTCTNKFRRGTAACSSTNVRADYMHEVVLSYLVGKLRQAKDDEAFWSRVDLATTSDDREKVLKDLNRQLDLAADKLADIYLQHDGETLERLVGAMKAKMKALEGERDRLRKELDEARRGVDLRTRVKKEIDAAVAQGFDSYLEDQDRLRDLFHKWIKSVTAYDLDADTVRIGRRKRLVIEWQVDDLKGSSV